MDFIDTARVDLGKLHPELKSLLVKLDVLLSTAIYKTKTGDKRGLHIFLTEGYRTKEHQDALYAQGRTTKGPIVTNARGSSYSSMHQWGIAVDFALREDIDGDNKWTDDTYNNSTGAFRVVGTLWESIGGEWGGNWKSIVDNPHLQLSGYGSTPSKLKALYNTPDNFIETWKAGQETGQAENKGTQQLPPIPPVANSTNRGYKVGQRVKIKPEGRQYDGSVIGDYWKQRTYDIASVKGDRVVLSYASVIMYAVKAEAIEPDIPYMFRTTCNSLNIRRGPGVTYSIVGSIDEDDGNKNLYTIVSEEGTWGKLKSGVGWVSLRYIDRV